MANKDVETKVVQVRFDNSKFSKNIKTTIKQTKEFDNSLKFKGRKQDIKEVQEALDKVEVKQLNKDLEKSDSILHKITVGFKDLVKIKLLSRAMDVVINKSTALIKSMLGINNVVAGWQQYEEQMINVGGILNQVQNKLKDDGSYYGLADVTEAMDRLRWYTDETSFSFTTLSNGIRQFVVAGIDLNKASEAAMGVTNLAGSAKVFDEFKIQSAMDAVAKSMQTGYMDTMKWTTLTNTAGIVTEEFSQKLLDAAVAQGKLVKSAAGQYKTKKGGKLVTTENIRSTLSDRWLTSGVMETAMGEYASASTAVKKFSDLMADQTEESLAKINVMFKDSGKEFKSFDEILTQMPEDVEDATELSARQTGKFLERLGYQFDEVSYKAFKSSQETTSFSQSIESVRKGISTKWSEIFESIFGNYEQATELWSDVSDKFYDMFILPFANLSDIFKTWKDLTEGGAEDFRSMVKTIIDVIGRFKDAVGEGFRAVFGEIDESWLQRITITLKNFFDNFKNNEKLFKGITAVTKIFASVLKITSKISQTLFKIISKIFVALEPVFDIVVGLVDKLADGIIWLIDTIDELGILDTIVKGLTTALEWLVTGIKKVFDWIKGKVDLKKIIDGLSKAVDKLREGLEWLGKQLTTGANKVKAWWKEQRIAQKVVENFSKAINKVKSAFSKTTDEVEAYNEAIVEAAINQGTLVKTENGEIKTAKSGKVVNEDTYRSSLSDEWMTAEVLEEANKKGEEEAKKLSWIETVKNAFKSLGDKIKQAYEKVKAFLEEKGIIDALKQFWAGLKEVVMPIWQTISGWFKELATLAKTDPEKAMVRLAGAIAIVVGILTILKVGGLMKAGKWVLEEFYNVLKAFRKRILAERWKIMAQALLYISASVLILTVAINDLAKIKVKDAWKAMGLIGAVVAAYVGIMLIMTKATGSIRGGFAAAMTLTATAIGLSIFISSFFKVLDKTSGKSTSEIWRAAGIVAALGSVLIGVIAVTFRKVEKTGFFTGSMVKGPGLFAMSKVILFIWAFMKLSFWFVDKVNSMDESAFKNGGIAFAAMMGTILTIYLVFTRFNKHMMKAEIDGQVVYKKLSVDFGGFILVILAALAIFKMAEGISIKAVGKGTLMILAIFGSIVGLTFALAGATRIVSKANPEKEAKLMTVHLGSIAFAVLITALTFKMINSLDWGQVLRGMAMTGAIYVAIAVLAGVMAKTQKTFAVLKITEKGSIIKRKPEKNPIAAAALSIAFSVLMIVAAIKLVNYIDPQEFAEGISRVAVILALVVVLQGVLNVTAKQVDGKGMMFSAISLFGSAIAVIALVYWFGSASKEYMDTIYAGIPAALAVLGVVVVLMGVVNLLNKFLGSTVKRAISLAVSMGVLVGAIFGIVGAIAVIGNVMKTMSAPEIQGAVILIGFLGGIIIGYAALMIKIAKKITGGKYLKDFQKKMILVSAAMAVMVGAIAALIGLIKITSMITTPQLWAGAGVITVISAVIIGLIAGMIGMTKLIKNEPTIGKDVLKLMFMITLMSLAMYVIIDAIARISVMNWKKAWLGTAIVGAIMAGLLLAMLAIIGISKVAKLATLEIPTLVAMGGLMIMMGVAILAIAGALFLVSMIPDDRLQDSARIIGIMAVILGAFAVAIAKIISGSAYKHTGELLAMSLLFAAMAAAMLSIAYSLELISKIPEKSAERAFRILTTLLAVVGGIAVIMVAMTSFAKSSGTTAVLAISLMFASIAASMLGIALALKMIASIDEDSAERAFRIVTILLIVVGAIAIALTALVVATGGIGAVALAAIAAIFVALGVAMVGVGAGLWLMAKAMEVFNNSLIKLMNNLTKDKINNLKDFAGALVLLTGAQLLSAIGNFATSILNLGSAFVDLYGSVIKLLGGILESLADSLVGLGELTKGTFEGLGKAISGWGDAQEAKGLKSKAEALQALADASRAFIDVDMSRITMIRDEVGKLSNMTLTKGSIKPAVEGLNQFKDSLINLSGAWSGELAAIVDLVNKIMWALAPMDANNLGSYTPIALFMLELDKLKELIDGIGDPVIKPVLDLEEFRKGMVQMSQEMLNYSALYDNYAGAVAAHGRRQVVDKYIQAMQDSANAIGAPQIIVNQTYNLNDQMAYSYDAARETGTAIEQAVRKASWLDYIRWPWSKK